MFVIAQGTLEKSNRTVSLRSYHAASPARTWIKPSLGGKNGFDINWLVMLFLVSKSLEPPHSLWARKGIDRAHLQSMEHAVRRPLCTSMARGFPCTCVFQATSHMREVGSVAVRLPVKSVAKKSTWFAFHWQHMLMCFVNWRVISACQVDFSNGTWTWAEKEVWTRLTTKQVQSGSSFQAVSFPN